MRLSPAFIILIFIGLFAFSRCDSLDISLTSYGINKSGVTYTFGLSSGTGNYRTVPAGTAYTITFPSDYTGIFPSSFTCDDGSGTILSCSRSGLVVTVTNLFSSPTTDFYFTVRVIGLTNPSHSSTTGSFTATIAYSTTISASNTVSISTGTSTCSITPASYVTGATTSWTFSITTSNPIPASGGLTITPIARWSFQTDNLLPTSTPTCSVTSPTTATPGSCAVSSSGTLEVRTMTSTAIAAGAVLSITITGFRNPPMTEAYTFTVTTLDTSALGIDSCSPTIQPTTANALSVASDFFYCTTNSNLKTVNTYDTCILTFKTTNPLPSGSTVAITFPSTVGLGSLLTIVSGSRTLSFTSPTSGNMINITSIVTSYTSGSTTIAVRFATVLQPSTTKPTASFQISTQYLGFYIDTITSGATYSAGTGALSSLSVTSSPATVSSSSASMTFSFVIGDALSTSATLTIAFPSELTLATSASCTGSGSKIAAGPTCSISSSTLSVSSFASSALVSGDTITIRLNSAVTLPSSAKPTSSFTIQTLDGGYAVDRSTSLAFSATAASIVTASVSVPSGSIVGDATTYTFSFVNVNAIPSTGQIQIALPTDDSFAISDSTTIAQGVSVTVGTNSAATVSSTVVTSSSPNTITFTNPTGASIAAGTTITFTVPKIRDPLSTASSSSFTLSTLTSDGYSIDTKSSGLALVANTLTAADFYSLTATLSPSTTGSSSTYKFKLISTIAQASTNIVQINFPSTFTFASSTTCQVITSSTSGTVSSCTPSSSNVFSVTLGQAVSAQTTFEVDISGVINPTAATSYSGFSVYTMISSGYLINQRTSGISVTVTPSTITTASLSRSTKTLSTPATYTFTFTPVNTYPSTAFIQMTVPTELILSSSPVCTGISGISTSLTCTVSSTNSNQFNITGSTTYSSSSISFSVATITNQPTQTNSSSFTIYVMTAAGLIIDQLTSGLVSESACSSNCLTCSDTNKNYCLSCPTTGNIYLDVPTHTCVSTCGTGTYLSSDNTQCLACNSNCFTCSGSATTCTSCDTTSSLAYLYNAVCYSSCPSGYYADSSNVCQACTSSSHCKTCSSATTCLSCNDNYYLLNGACGTSCDSGYYADSSSWSCKTCVNHCLTCSSATTCTGCDTTSSYPILYGTSCLSSCPSGYYQSAYDCIACTSPCATCSGSSSYCLTCTAGLYPDNGECKTCSSSCGTCSGSPTSCASCNPGKYLQGTTCVTACSDGYYLDSGSATCKACSSKCQTCSALNKCTSCDTSSSYPYFYQDGETCVRTCPSSVPRVVNGVCTASNTVAFVNPYSGIYLSGLPFPFIIFGAIFCGLVGVGKIINTKTLVTSNIIGFLGLLEFSTWIAMVILLALSHPGDPVSDYVGLPIVIVAIVTSLILNGFFYWRLVKPQIKSEQYVSWKKAKKSNRISSIMIQTLSIVCFKTFRLVYSRFFGLEFMSAQLDESKAFLKRLHKYTGINFVISVLPALIAAIITLNEDSDNYPQLLRISVEVLVISLVLIIVSIYDGFKSNKLEENENGITAIIHGQVLSMIEKTVIDKLNESIESGKVKRPQSKLSAYRRRNSLNLDQSYEYNEANSSFLNLNRTEKILTGVGMKHEESFNESVDGVIGRDAQGNAIRRVNAIQEEKEDDDEPTLNMKNKTLGQLRDMLKDRGHDLEPEKIMIENKDGSVIVLRDKSSYLQNATNMKTSPSKSQVSSIRGTDEEAGRGRMSKFVSEDEEFQKLTGRKGQPSTGRRIQDKAMELDENGQPKYGSPQSNHRVGTNARKASDESEEELELHDSYGNLEAKFGKNVLPDSQNHLASLNRGLENLSPIGNMGSRAMDNTPDRTIQNHMEDDQDEEELEVHSQTPSKTGPRQSGDDNHLRSSPGFAGKPPTGRKGNKSSAKKNPNQQTPGGKNNSKEDFEYVSSDSQLSVEDVHDHFQDDTPSNYDALNQRFDENLYQQQLNNMGRRPDSRATNVSNAQNMSTRSIPKSHLPPVNEIQESHRRSTNQPPVQMVNNNYFSDGMEDGDLPPVRGKSIESVGSQKNSTAGNNNAGILQRHKNKVVPFATGGASERSNSMGKRAMTPQHNINSRTAQTSSSRGFDTHSNSFSQNKRELNQTVKNFHRAANQRAGSKVFDSQRDGRSSSREDTRRPGSVDKMKRLEGIYANKVIVPRLNKISSRGSNKVANSRGFIDDDLDNDGLEIHDFGKFESIVNGMKKKETEEGDSIDKNHN